MSKNFEVIEAWKQTIENQRHFNEICMKIRTLAITTISAFIGAVAFLIKDLDKLSDLNSVAYGTITVIAAIAWFAFYIMDVQWYHKLLSGSVKHAINSIEKKYKKDMPELSLSSKIKKEAAKGEMFKEHPSFRIDLFYILGGVVIILPFFIFIVFPAVIKLLETSHDLPST